MTRTGFGLAGIGASLLVLSYWPIHRAIREERLRRQFVAQYDHAEILFLPDTGRARLASCAPILTERRDASSFTLQYGAHRLDLSDGLGRGTDTQPGIVHVEIDERDYTIRSPILIQRPYDNIARYNSWLAVYCLHDRVTKQSRVVLIRRIARDTRFEPMSAGAWRFRFTFLSLEGAVIEEEFSFRERAEPVYRGGLIARGGVTPMPVGILSDELAWPSFADLLYPWLTGLVGLVLTTLGLIRAAKGRTAKP